MDVPLLRALHPLADNDVLVSISVSPAGEAVAMWSSAGDRDRLFERDCAGPNAASFPRATPDTPVPVRITVDGPQGRRGTWSSVVPISFPTAHAMPEGRILVIGARAQWRPEGGQHNAFLYAGDGVLERSACVGDGVEWAQTTTLGSLWVGYFDEGIFGNLGWGGPGPEPIGAPGLNRFDASLALAWSFPAVDRDICDCYALTTSGEACVVCPYTDWPVFRAREDGRIERWTNEIEGATAMVADRNRIALVGGYDGNRDRVVVGTLADGVLRVDGRGRLTLGGGEFKPTRLIGRDGTLHAFVDATWYSIPFRLLAGAVLDD